MKVSKAQAKKLGLATKEKICEGCGARSETTRRTCRSCGCRMVDNPFPYRLGTGPPHKKPSKYKNVRVMVDGIVFDSKREAKRWSELRLLQFARKIGLVFCQMPYDLHAAGGKKVLCVFHHVARMHVPKTLHLSSDGDDLEYHCWCGRFVSVSLSRFRDHILENGGILSHFAEAALTQ